LLLAAELAACSLRLVSQSCEDEEGLLFSQIESGYFFYSEMSGTMPSFDEFKAPLYGKPWAPFLLLAGGTAAGVMYFYSHPKKPIHHRPGNIAGHPLIVGQTKNTAPVTRALDEAERILIEK
jgi:hypothetical protein